MFKSFHSFTFAFLLLAIPSIINAQNLLTHDTGPIRMTVYDDGVIGEFVFDSNVNANFVAGIIGGNLTLGGAFGMIGSFIDASGPIIEDYVNVTPFSGFYSDPFFNQISAADLEVTLVPGAEGHIVYKSNTGQNFVFHREVITNNSGFDYANLFYGVFADWDVGNFALNRGGYDPQRNMLYQYENGGAADPNYYGIMLVNVPPNTIRGTVDKDIAVTDEAQLRMDIFDLMTSTTFLPITVNGDYRTYLSSGPYSIPSGESLILDYAFVAGTSLTDLQANSDQAANYGINLPVELTSFTANVNRDGNVMLNWSTATEINNQMFEIERKSQNGQYVVIGYVDGYGTSTEPREYSYTDNTVETGTYFYRLKQIDFGGQFEYSDEVEIEVNGPLSFALEQNYPNPFNPSTNIKFGIPIAGPVKLAVYNLVGEEVAVLVNDVREAGFYEITFNASNLPSGTYFYKAESANTVLAKKMILLR